MSTLPMIQTNQFDVATANKASASLQSMLARITFDIECEDMWEQELDRMGSSASNEELTAHLAIAPNPESPMAIYLKGYLYGLDIQPILRQSKPVVTSADCFWRIEPMNAP